MTACAVFVSAAVLAAGAEAPDREARGPSTPTAAVPTATFAPDGALWLVWVEGTGVWVGRSTDQGRTFPAPVRVNPLPEAVDANGEARPKIALGPGGEVYVSYTRKGERPFTGDIRFSRRLLDGTFSEPVTVNDDGLATGHRFDALTASPQGVVHLVWIDKRNVERSAGSAAEEGAALYQAVSADGGRSFSANRKVKAGVCECCRLAVGWEGGTPVVLFRDLLAGGVRDHSVARVDADTVDGARATDDGWAIAGCPHHGPAFAIGADGVWHLAWFTGDGMRGSGTFYRRSTDRGRTFSEPIRMGSDRAGRATLLASRRRVWLAWKEPLASGGAVVNVVGSGDGGLTWSDPRVVARTDGASDHPALIARGADAFLSWFTAEEGYRLTAID